jgi:energy-coupling factor transporter ATP-binding protein EcfA2
VNARALLIIGAPGSGKSTLLDTLRTRLEIDQVVFGAVECDELGRGWPYPPLLAVLARLTAVTTLQHEAGCGLLLIVATPETDDELQRVITASGRKPISALVTFPWVGVRG